MLNWNCIGYILKRILVRKVIAIFRELDMRLEPELLVLRCRTGFYATVRLHDIEFRRKSLPPNFREDEIVILWIWAAEERFSRKSLFCQHIQL